MDMKKLIIALVLNICMLILALTVFLNKGIPSGVYNWRFYASLVGLLTFLFFFVAVLIELRKRLRKSDRP